MVVARRDRLCWLMDSTSVVDVAVADGVAVAVLSGVQGVFGG